MFDRVIQKIEGGRFLGDGVHSIPDRDHCPMHSLSRPTKRLSLPHISNSKSFYHFKIIIYFVMPNINYYNE